MANEIIWNGHDNTVDLILKSNGTAYALSNTTKITASFGHKRIESVDSATGLIRWSSNLGYETGELRIKLSTYLINPGSYEVPIVTYEPNYPNGLVWGEIKIKVIPEVEATAT